MSDTRITDKHGQQYVLDFICDSQSYLHIMVFDHNQWVGEVKCLFPRPHTMELSDIRLLDNVVPRGRGWLWLVPYRLREKWWAKNYQNRGIGTALLRFVLSYAKQHDVNSVFGYVVRKDYMHNSHLLDWYRQFGFSVVLEEDQTAYTAARIYMNI